MPIHWRIWVGALVTTNMVALFFLSHVEAWVVLIAFMLGAVTQMYMLAKKGFVRLLGLGHVYWIPLFLYAMGDKKAQIVLA